MFVPSEKVVLWIIVLNLGWMHLIAWRAERRQAKDRKQTPSGGIQFLLRYLPAGWKIWLAISTLAGSGLLIALYYRGGQ